MTGAVLGLDTSNYRTSIAVVSRERKILLNRRELLPVEAGARGLRQSDAVYAHLKQIKPMMEDLRATLSEVRLDAVCASTAPRNQPDSYMPVFEVGDTIGRGIAASMGIPFFPTDHQHGHIRAAQAGTGLDGAERFLGLHLSGGTTDLLLLDRGEVKMLGTSLDLHAGQLVDRIGVALGCSFPAGEELEQLARRGSSAGRLGTSMDCGGLSCHLSGAEAETFRWIQKAERRPEDIAREVFDFLVRTTLKLLLAGARSTGAVSALLFGGIASSGLFREMLHDRMRRERSFPVRIVFGRSELSGDNAVGTALIGADAVYGVTES